MSQRGRHRTSTAGRLALGMLALSMAACNSSGPGAPVPAPPPLPPPAPPPGAVPDLTPLDALLSSTAAIDAMGGGGSMLLIYQGEVIYRKGFGSFTPETVVPVASSSKLVSGVLVAKLIDQGVLDADTPVDAFYDFDDADDPKARMTVAQLFSHTAGLNHSPALQRNADYPSIDANVADIFQRVAMLYDPGTTLHYAGVGMQIVGGMAERATGLDWQTLWQQEVGSVLRMDATDYLGYVSGNITATDNPNVSGSVRTNIDDYGHLLQMLFEDGVFDGQRVLSAAAVDMLLENYSRDLPVIRTPYDPYLGANAAVAEFRTGIGNWLIDASSPAAERPAFVMSGGAFGCSPFIDFERGLIGVYLPFNRERVPVDDEVFANPAGTLFYQDIWPLLQSLFPVR